MSKERSSKDSFNKAAKNHITPSNQQTSEPSIIASHMKNAKSPKIKASLIKVESEYKLERSALTYNQNYKKNVYANTKIPTHENTPTGEPKYRYPYNQEIQAFADRQQIKRQQHRQQWIGRAGLATEGKEWRDKNINQHRREKEAIQKAQRQKQVETLKNKFKRQAQPSTKQTFNKAAKKP